MSGQIVPRRAEIDAIKAVAIVGVLFLHMSFKSRMNASTLEVVHFFQLVFGWAVIAFFFAAGAIARAVHGFPALKEFASTRFKRLIVPCLVFSWTYKLILLGIARAGLAPVSEAFDIVSFMLAPVGPQFYFLPLLFGISLLVALLEIRVSASTLLSVTGVLLVAAYAVLPIPAEAYGNSIALWPVYLFAYVSGRAMAADGMQARFGAVIKPALFVLLASAIHAAPVILYACVPLLLNTAFGRHARSAQIIERSGLGKYSSAIYVWHAPIVMPLVSVVCAKLLMGSALVLLPLLGFTIILSVFLGKTTMRFHSLRFWRF